MLLISLRQTHLNFLFIKHKSKQTQANRQVPQCLSAPASMHTHLGAHAMAFSIQTNKYICIYVWRCLLCTLKAGTQPVFGNMQPNKSSTQHYNT